MSWADFRAWVRHQSPDSVLSVAVHGPAPTDPVLVMLGIVADRLAVANWQRGRPGSAPPRLNRWPWSPKSADAETFGAAAPVTDIRDFLLWRNGRAPEGVTVGD